MHSTLAAITLLKLGMRARKIEEIVRREKLWCIPSIGDLG
jgi:hypothetical protein